MYLLFLKKYPLAKKRRDGWNTAREDEKNVIVIFAWNIWEKGLQLFKRRDVIWDVYPIRYTVQTVSDAFW